MQESKVGQLAAATSKAIEATNDSVSHLAEGTRVAVATMKEGFQHTGLALDLG